MTTFQELTSLELTNQWKVTNLSLFKGTKHNYFIYPVEQLWTKICLEFFHYYFFHTSIWSWLIISSEESHRALSTHRDGSRTYIWSHHHYCILKRYSSSLLNQVLRNLRDWMVQDYLTRLKLHYFISRKIPLYYFFFYN